MLIGTTVIGLQKMLKAMRLAQKTRAREEEHNKNIFESIIAADANKQNKIEEESRELNFMNIRDALEKDKDSFISWMMTNQANNNSIMMQAQNAAHEQSFAIKEAQRLAAMQKAVGL